MLVAGAALVAVAALAIVPRLSRVRRRAVALRATAAEAERDTLAALALLRSRRAETEALLVPWRRMRRWLRHPLVVATLDWYRRRRRAGRPAAH